MDVEIEREFREKYGSRMVVGRASAATALQNKNKLEDGSDAVVNNGTNEKVKDDGVGSSDEGRA